MLFYKCYTFHICNLVSHMNSNRFGSQVISHFVPLNVSFSFRSFRSFRIFARSYMLYACDSVHCYCCYCLTSLVSFIFQRTHKWETKPFFRCLNSNLVVIFDYDILEPKLCLDFFQRNISCSDHSCHQITLYQYTMQSMFSPPMQAKQMILAISEIRLNPR